MLRVAVLMPVRDDWTSAAELIRQLNKTLSAYPCILDIVLMDDGSVQLWRDEDFAFESAVVGNIQIVRLRRNLGHQRAIAIGLVHIEKSISCDAVLVMDADGEDTAEGALQLVRAFANQTGRKTAIFGARARRTEGRVFRWSYRAYKAVHYILTGYSVQVGNFSILPAEDLGTLVVMSELWNQYSASFFRSGLPYVLIPIPRGYRIAGESRMNYVTLAAHGLSAISVFGDLVAVRVLIGSIMAVVTTSLGIAGVLVLRFTTNRVVPIWATYSIGALAIVLIQIVALALTFTFTMLGSRINLSFVPLRDYALFIAGVRDLDLAEAKRV